MHFIFLKGTNQVVLDKNYAFLNNQVPRNGIGNFFAYLTLGASPLVLDSSQFVFFQCNYARLYEDPLFYSH